MGGLRRCCSKPDLHRCEVNHPKKDHKDESAGGSDTHSFSLCAENKLIPSPFLFFRLIPKKLQQMHMHGFKYPPERGGGGESCIFSSSLNRDDLQEFAVFPLRAARSLQNRSFVFAIPPLCSRGFFTHLHDVYIHRRRRRPRAFPGTKYYLNLCIQSQHMMSAARRG